MRKSKVVLFGSRSTDFFKPGCSSRKSDYDFYVEDNLHCIAMFMAYMRSIGVCWKLVSGTEEDIARQDDAAYMLAKFRLIRGIIDRDGHILDMRLIWRHNHSGSQCVMKFHSTAPQCFISGFAAVSLYHDLTSNDRPVAWYLNDIFLDPGELIQTENIVDLFRRLQEEYGAMTVAGCGRQIDRNYAAKKKYINKGFTYVTRTCESEPMGKFGGILRHLGDEKSYINPLDDYLDVSSWDPTFDEYINRLSYLSWIELDGRIEVIANPLSKYAHPNKLPKIFNVRRSIEYYDEYKDYVQRVLASGNSNLWFNSC